MKPKQNTGKSGKVHEAAPLKPQTEISTPGAIREINTKGLSRAEIVAINRSIGNPDAIPELLALCLPRATSHSKANAADGQRVNQPIQRSA